MSSQPGVNARSPDRLAGQVAVVTGASSGIGQGVARSLARAGAAVVIDYQSHEEDARQLAAGIAGAGGQALAAEADVSREDQVADLVARTVEVFGALDIMAANSGLQRDAPSADMTLADWQKVST